MRIGLITGEYPPLQGGISDYTDILARNLTAQGHAVHIFSDARAEQQQASIPVTRLRGPWRWNSLRQVRIWAREQRLDVLNLQFQTAAYAMSPWVHFMPRFVDVPFVTTFHDLRFPYLFPKAGPLRTWIVDRLARHSDAAITSDYQDFERLEGLTLAHHIRIGSNIPDTLPDDYTRQAWRRRAGAKDTTFLLGFFGFLNHTKGFDTLLYALRRLCDAQVPVRLIHVGGDAGTADPTNVAYAAQITQLIETLGLSDVVHFTGYLDDEDVSAYLNACDLVVLPFRDGASQRRGSLIAAIVQGCAIVTTQPLHPTDHFSDDAFCFVPADDVDALTDAIARLHAEPARVATLREGTKVLRKQFEWGAIAQQTVAVYEAAMGVRS